MPRGIERKLLDSNGNPTGASQFLTESLPGSGNTDTLLSSPPASGARTAAVFGLDIRQQYITEPPRTVNPQQLTNMSQQLFFHPNFRFSIDFFGWMSVADRLKMGINCFSNFAITVQQRSEIPAGSGMYEIPEAAVHNGIEGYEFYRRSLSKYHEVIKSSFEGIGHSTGTLSNFGQINFNIETSQFWGPGNINEPNLPGFPNVGGNCNTGHYPNWNSIKNDRVRMESKQNTEMSWAELAAEGEGAWLNEIWYTRRINRLSLMLQVATAISAPGSIIRYGTSMSQSYPTTAKRDSTGLFIDGNCNVSNVRATDAQGNDTGGTGDGSGNIVLNGQSFNLRGTLYNYENGDQGYWYLQHPEFSPADYNTLFNVKPTGSQNYPTGLWPKVKTEHVTAMEKGYWQQNRRMMRLKRADGQAIGIMRQDEVIYEGNEPRVPFPELQGAGGETPKIHKPPYMHFSSVVSCRFLKGNDHPANGYRSFFICSPNEVVLPPNNPAWDRWNHHWHSYTAMIQGRMYCQRLESWFTGSTLIENPDVKIGATGNWQNYDAVDAYADGNPNAQRPCSAMRYKELTNGDIQLEILLGMNQPCGTSRTDQFRAPGGSALRGNSFQITYSGPATRIISVLIPAGSSNQLFDLGNVSVSAWELAGYAGRTQFPS